MSYRDHKTNEYLWKQVNILAGRRALLLPTINRRKLSWFGHACSHDTLPKIIQLGKTDRSHRRGRPRKTWTESIEEWTGQSMPLLLRIADDRSQWTVGRAEVYHAVPERRLGELVC